MTVCLHCHKPCRLTDGREIYPHRPDLAKKPIWKCDPCKAHVGCHPGTQEPLGFAADAQTRKARMTLHSEMLDPIWKTAPKKRRSATRNAVYAFLSRAMGLDRDETHTGMWTIEQCRDAWRHLKGHTHETIMAQGGDA